MFRQPEDRRELLYVVERLAGMGWLIATDTVRLSLLRREGRRSWFRAETEFDSAEFEFLSPKYQGCFGTLSTEDLQWTKANVEKTFDAMELDAMRCNAIMYALEQYVKCVTPFIPDMSVTVHWGERLGYTVMLMEVEDDVVINNWIIGLNPNFELTSMSRSNR